MLIVVEQVDFYTECFMVCLNYILERRRNNMNVNITYLDHSGFLVEWNNCYWLFDYFKGQIPQLDSSKMLLVFVSHSHGDHFNPEIFDLYNKHPMTTYLISSDIKIDEKTKPKYGITDEVYQRIIVVKSNEEYELFDQDNISIVVNTLKSTDKGVAFIIRYKEKTIYHAGDLNLWMWIGDDKQYNNDMKARFYKEITKLKGMSIDIAFAPLDPRQEDWYSLGINALLDTAKVRYVFPMHFWDKPETIKWYKLELEVENNERNTEIMDVSKQGHSWKLDI